MRAAVIEYRATGPEKLNVAEHPMWILRGVGHAMVLDQRRRQQQRNDGCASRFSTESIRELIIEALPTRELDVERDVLVAAIVERIEAWRVTWDSGRAGR